MVSAGNGETALPANGGSCRLGGCREVEEEGQGRLKSLPG